MPALTSIALGTALAASAAGTGIGASKKKKALKEQKRILGQMNADNESDFLRGYYQNAFDDPTSRTYLKRISGDLYDHNKGIENSGISTGATHENTQANKQAANEVMSDAVNNVVVNHETAKRAEKDRYIQRKDAIASGNIQLAQQKGEMQAQNWTNAGNLVARGLTGIAGTGMLDGKTLFPGKPSGVDAAAANASLNDLTQRNLLEMDANAITRNKKTMDNWGSF